MAAVLVFIRGGSTRGRSVIASATQKLLKLGSLAACRTVPTLKPRAVMHLALEDPHRLSQQPPDHNACWSALHRCSAMVKAAQPGGAALFPIIAITNTISCWPTAKCTSFIQIQAEAPC